MSSGLCASRNTMERDHRLDIRRHQSKAINKKFPLSFENRKFSVKSLTMNRYLLAVIISLLTVLFIFLYWKNGQKHHLTLSAGRPGGIYKPLAESIAAAVKKAYPKISIHVIDSNGGTENYHRLRTGQVDLAIIGNEIPTNDPIRVLTPLHQEYLHFFARHDANINSINDLEGKKVSIGPVNSGTEKLIYRILHHYGVDTSKFEPKNLAFGDAQKEILTGSIDAALFVAGFRAEICDSTLYTGEVKLVGFGDAKQEWGETRGFIIKYPYIEPAVIPVYTYPVGLSDIIGEPRKPVSTLSLQALLVSHDDVSDDVAKKITETIFNSRHALIQAHIAAIQISETFDESKLRFRLHPGARSYYQRHEPLFVVKYAEPMALFISLLIALVALRQWFVNNRKNRIDKYYSRLDDIYAEIRNKKIQKEDVERLQTELPKILHDAFSELVNERLLANESFIIFLILYINIYNRIRERLETFPTP